MLQQHCWRAASDSDRPIFVSGKAEIFVSDFCDLQNNFHHCLWKINGCQRGKSLEMERAGVVICMTSPIITI